MSWVGVRFSGRFSKQNRVCLSTGSKPLRASSRAPLPWAVERRTEQATNNKAQRTDNGRHRKGDDIAERLLNVVAQVRQVLPALELYAASKHVAKQLRSSSRQREPRSPARRELPFRVPSPLFLVPFPVLPAPPGMRRESAPATIPPARAHARSGSASPHILAGSPMDRPLASGRATVIHRTG